MPSARGCRDRGEILRVASPASGSAAKGKDFCGTTVGDDRLGDNRPENDGRGDCQTLFTCGSAQIRRMRRMLTRPAMGCRWASVVESVLLAIEATVAADRLPVCRHARSLLARGQPRLDIGESARRHLQRAQIGIAHCARGRRSWRRAGGRGGRSKCPSASRVRAACGRARVGLGRGAGQNSTNRTCGASGKGAQVWFSVFDLGRQRLSAMGRDRFRSRSEPRGQCRAR